MDISIIPYAKAREYVSAALETVFNRLAQLPPAQPERIREALETVFNRLEQLPPMQPKPRTAHWTKDIVGSVVCSNCGGIRKDDRISHMNFCNCCGADMRDREEGE